MSPHKVDMLPSKAALHSYGISVNGFLPAEPPLTRLPHQLYEPWENLAQFLPSILSAGKVRELVDEMPVLDIHCLQAEAEWRRAYSVLAVLAQSYIWQGPEPSERLPPSIVVPLLRVSEHLEVKPVATYAALNLWNWIPIKFNADLGQPENLEAPLLQTGSEDESWFFTISNAMEARARAVIEKMLDAISAAEQGDLEAVIDSLEYLRRSIEAMAGLLERMDEGCHPHVFYHRIRPFLAGSMNMKDAGLPHGVFYDEGHGIGHWHKYRGGSNGQSSLLQFFDAFLGVQHERSGDFHAEMREYMPGPHRRFLDDFEAVANIRGFVDSRRHDTKLLSAYNAAVASLGCFRDKHMALVTRYIVIPSRSVQPGHREVRRNLATTSNRLASHGSGMHLVGTGGTTLIPFLRVARDDTIEATVI